MYFFGVDIGSRGVKGVIIQDEGGIRIVSAYIGNTSPDTLNNGIVAFEGAAKGTGLGLQDMSNIVATGYGRLTVPLASANVSEISCHAKGANWFFPSVRTILDMGGQDCKAIRCDNRGVVSNFVMNDKCAGGTGRFLELIATILGLGLEDIGKLSLESLVNVPFSTVCAVFAKEEALELLNKGVAKADILAGLHEAVSVRANNLLQRVGIEKDFMVTGGIAKNQGMVAKIVERVGLHPMMPVYDPQITGALGAALFAKERCLAR